MGTRVRLPAGTGSPAVVWPIASLRLLDAKSRPVRIPAGAVLRFAVGFHDSVRATPGDAVEAMVWALGERGERVRIFRRRVDPRAQAGWREERVPLAALAGREVTFVFQARRATHGRGGPPSPLLWGDPVLLAPRTETPERRSVVLVSLDTLRARSTSLYGYERETTPGLERIARAGVLFRRAYTTFSNTLGAHASMLTGLYPTHHRTTGAGARLPRRRPTLAEVLRRAGYQTAAYTEDGRLSARFGFSRGFSYFWENREVSEGAGVAKDTFSRAVGWLEGHRREGPFLLFVHTYAVHAPYRPAAPYRRLFVGSAPPEDEAARDRLAYEQEARELDDDVTQLVERIDELVPPERTVLVITADHGEEFLEHGMRTHRQLFDEVMHVPLLIRAPGLVPAGRTVDGVVSLVDVVPTILDLLGVRTPPGLDGESLVALWRGGGDGRDRDVAGRTVFGQWPTIERGWGHGWVYVARQRDAKCILRRDRPPECFDTASDPEEKRPESPQQDRRFRALATAARQYAASHVGPPRPGPTSEPAAPDQARQRKLRALGYIE